MDRVAARSTAPPPLSESTSPSPPGRALCGLTPHDTGKHLPEHHLAFTRAPAVLRAVLSFGSCSPLQRFGLSDPLVPLCKLSSPRVAAIRAGRLWTASQSMRVLGSAAPHLLEPSQGPPRAVAIQTLLSSGPCLTSPPVPPRAHQARGSVLSEGGPPREETGLVDPSQEGKTW